MDEKFFFSGDRVSGSPDFIKRIKVLLIWLVIGVAYYINSVFGLLETPCPFRFITSLFVEDGLKCPGCGITKLILNEIHFDFKLAFFCNPALFILQPFIIYEVVKLIWCYLLAKKATYSKIENVILWVSITCLVLFGIVRNFFDI